MNPCVTDLAVVVVVVNDEKVFLYAEKNSVFRGRTYLIAGRNGKRVNNIPRLNASQRTALYTNV